MVVSRTRRIHSARAWQVIIALALWVGLVGCQTPPGTSTEPIPAGSSPSASPTFTPSPTDTRTPTPTLAPTDTPTPSPTPVPTVRFAVIGDYGVVGARADAVSKLVHGWEPDFVITVGDNSYGPIIDDDIGLYYHDFIHPYVGRHGEGAEVNRFWPALGNHDWDRGVDRWHEFLTLPDNERYYDVTIGPVGLFALDADYREPDGIAADSVQAQWLKVALAESRACWNVVYFHIPPYSSGSFHGSDPVMRWPFGEWGADVVMAGHEHSYERLSVDGIPYFVNGLGGASIYAFGDPLPESQARYNAANGAMLVTAGPASIVYEFVNVRGETVDAYSVSGGCVG